MPGPTAAKLSVVPEVDKAPGKVFWGSVTTEIPTCPKRLRSSTTFPPSEKPKDPAAPDSAPDDPLIVVAALRKPPPASRRMNRPSCRWYASSPLAQCRCANAGDDASAAPAIR